MIDIIKTYRWTTVTSVGALIFGVLLGVPPWVMIALIMVTIMLARFIEDRRTLRRRDDSGVA